MSTRCDWSAALCDGENELAEELELADIFEEHGAGGTQETRARRRRRLARFVGGGISTDKDELLFAFRGLPGSRLLLLRGGTGDGLAFLGGGR